MLNPHQFKGHPYEQEIEHVPVDALVPLREWDREQTPRDDPGHLDRLTESIKEKGITSPLILTYGKNDQRAILGEGNHRLAAARRLGMSHVPVRVNRVTAVPHGERVPGHDPSMGHVPQDLRPSQIGLPTRKR